MVATEIELYSSDARNQDRIEPGKFNVAIQPGIWYNISCLGGRKRGVLLLNAVGKHNKNIVGKTPSKCGFTSRLSPRQRWQSLGGRFVMVKKPAEYWKDLENIKKELEPFLDGDELLSNYRVINTNHPTLARNISMYHGGIQQVRIALRLNKKRCSKCGLIKDVETDFRLTRGENGRAMLREGQCKQCGYDEVVRYRNTDMGTAASICRFTKARAKKQGWDYDLDREWVLARLNEIDWKCQVTGVPFERIGKNFFESWTSVSIDRIDSSGGYTRDNVEFVIAWVNKAKSNLPMDLFLDFCKLVVEYNHNGG